MAEKTASPKKFKLAKGKSLQIRGLSTLITNDNVNDPNVIKLITRAESEQGTQHFGKTIIEVK
jgi:hypothetical protein